MLAVLVIGDIRLLQSVRPQNDQLEINVHKISQPDVLSQQPFSDRDNFISSLISVLYYEEHCLGILPFPSHGIIPKL